MTDERWQTCRCSSNQSWLFCHSWAGYIGKGNANGKLSKNGNAGALPTNLDSLVSRGICVAFGGSSFEDWRTTASAALFCFKQLIFISDHVSSHGAGYNKGVYKICCKYWKLSITKSKQTHFSRFPQNLGASQILIYFVTNPFNISWWVNFYRSEPLHFWFGYNFDRNYDLMKSQ